MTSLQKTEKVEQKKASEVPKKTTNDELLINRAIGCLMGQAVGDALGTRYEFKSAKTTKACLKKDIKKGHLPMLGEGPFDLVPGQVTDDTELALALANSLVNKKSFNIYDIAQMYTLWYHSPPFDIGATTSTAFGLTNLKDTPENNYGKIYKSSAANNQKSLSNGCLMRISPLAIAGVRWKLENLQMAAKMDCELTNPNPIALDAVSVYVTAIQTAILTGDPLKTYDAALESATTKDIQDLLVAAVEKPDPIKLSDGKEVSTDSQFMGYLGVALQNAFYELLNTDSFEQALVNIISRGGDTDTNGCIAGALLGAVHGYDKIPSDWTDTVLEAKTEKRQKEYPYADTSDLIETALLLVGEEDDHIPEPVFKGEFEEAEADEENEGDVSEDDGEDD